MSTQRIYRPPRRMIELGDQEFVKPLVSKVAKKYFENTWDHVSIDLTGHNGSLKRNLCYPITDIEPADVVTNCGTVEHCSDQYECFKNIHNLCKVGGLIIHFLPLVGGWKGHCKYHYRDVFISSLSTLNGYEILYFNISKSKNALLTCVLKRTLELAFFFTNRDIYSKGIVNSEDPVTNPESLHWIELEKEYKQ
jgi:hypothetical protein